MTVKFKPLKDRVLIVVPEVEEKSAGGIILPDDMKEEPLQGAVIAVGDDVKQVEVGDDVLFTKWAGTKIFAGLLMNEGDILGVIS